MILRTSPSSQTQANYSGLATEMGGKLGKSNCDSEIQVGIGTKHQYRGVGDSVGSIPCLQVVESRIDAFNA